MMRRGALARAVCAVLCALQACASDVVQLGANNFTSTLEAMDASTQLVVEYYANWCPHCRHFAPTFEQVAHFFVEAHDQAPVTVMRVDCALEHELCRKFEVHSYPTVTMGTAAQYIAVQQFGVQGVDLHVAAHENAKPAAGIIQDVLTYFAIPPVPIPDHLSAKPPRQPHAQPPPTGNSTAPDGAGGAAAGGAANATSGVPLSGSAPAVQEQRAGKAEDAGAQAQPNATKEEAVAAGAERAQRARPARPRARVGTFGTPPATAADVRDVVSATVQTYHEILEADADLHLQRAPFLDFWGLVAAAHPAPACRAGAAALLDNVAIWWPQGAAELWKPPKDMLEHEVCAGATEATGVRAAQPYYACAGSGPEFRGYTCGMWMLLHATAAGLPEAAPVRAWTQGVRAWTEAFFRCEECRGHFLAELNSPAFAALVSKRDAVLWIWEAHNRVNERIAGEEAEQGTGDPAWPKVQWPSAQDCAACQSSGGGWNTDEVYAFLLRWYAPVQAPEAAGAGNGTRSDATGGAAKATQAPRDSERQQKRPFVRPEPDAPGDEGPGGDEGAEDVAVDLAAAAPAPRRWLRWVGLLLAVWLAACSCCICRGSRLNKRARRYGSLSQPL